MQIPQSPTDFQLLIEQVEKGLSSACHEISTAERSLRAFEREQDLQDAYNRKIAEDGFGFFIVLMFIILVTTSVVGILASMKVIPFH